MEMYVLISVLVVLAGIGAFFLLRRTKGPGRGKDPVGSGPAEAVTEDPGPAAQGVRFEELSALTEAEAAALVEIKDPRLLAKIDNALSGTLQILGNVGALEEYREAVKAAGKLYRAILPKGASLTESKSLQNAVRGIYHGAKGIGGHANLVPVEGNLGSGLAAMNVASAGMSASAMVVGMYYMKQVNDQLGQIGGELDRIAAFQDREYQSRVYALVAQVQKCSQFQAEILESEELRKRELDHLKSLEQECAQLLGQANLTLKEYEKKTGLDYAGYEKLVAEAQVWYQVQQILLDVMLEIGELSYALNLGAVSRENCSAMFLPYARQADEALEALKAWHEKTGAALEIDLDENRRRRQGVEGFFMNIPAIFNQKLHYRELPERTASMIAKQSAGQQNAALQHETDRFQKDVCLIVKDGKLYYLPEEPGKDG